MIMRANGIYDGTEISVVGGYFSSCGWYFMEIPLIGLRRGRIKMIGIPEINNYINKERGRQMKGANGVWSWDGCLLGCCTL
jgi:hypothetical protein